ncbi:hypothetical protein RND81_13G083500 [Saponaria officinalis]|uniref:Secreted protein n=1 Tax=Saponaria officinalis TaxID=3572 RepID=A0AAW1GYG7_SAPOF
MRRFSLVAVFMWFVPCRRRWGFLLCAMLGGLFSVLLRLKPDLVSEQMVRFSNSLSRESIVDIVGVVSVPNEPLKRTTRQVWMYGCCNFERLCVVLLEYMLISLIVHSDTILLNVG